MNDWLYFRLCSEGQEMDPQPLVPGRVKSGAHPPYKAHMDGL